MNDHFAELAWQNRTKLFVRKMNAVLGSNLGDPRHVGTAMSREFFGAAREEFLESWYWRRQ